MLIHICAHVVIRTINYQTFPQQCQLSEITALNAIAADCAASLSLVYNAGNGFLALVHGEGIESPSVIEYIAGSMLQNCGLRAAKSRGTNWLLPVVLVMVHIYVHMFDSFRHFRNVVRSLD